MIKTAVKTPKNVPDTPYEADAEKSLMTVAGTDQVPYLLNGALVDGIEYDLKTGKAKGQLSSKPGSLRRPSPRKRK